MDLLNKCALELQDFKNIIGSYKGNTKTPVTEITGLSHIHKAHLITALTSNSGADKRCVVITSREREASALAGDLEQLGKKVLVYPEKDLLFREMSGVSHDYQHQRLKVLTAMIRGDYDVIVSSVKAALQLTIPKKYLAHGIVDVKVGDSIDLKALEKVLITLGYVNSTEVMGAGQFSVRGGILDVFTPNYSNPLRIELWGDEIDSINFFDIESQRRFQSLDNAEIIPTVEIIFKSPETLAEKLEKIVVEAKGEVAEKIRYNLMKDADMLRGGVFPKAVDKYITLAYDEESCLLSYMDKDILMVSESQNVKDALKTNDTMLHEDIKGLLEEGIITKAFAHYSKDMADFEDVILKKGCIFAENFARDAFKIPMDQMYSINAKQISPWNGNIDVLKEDLIEVEDKDYLVIILAGTKKSGRLLETDLQREGITATFVDKVPAQATMGTYIISGSLTYGADYPLSKVMLITHGQVKKGEITRAPKRRKDSKAVRKLSELQKGDYVVHSVHGIGIFEGIENLEVQGIKKDYIKIRYNKGDYLYVPVTQLDLVSKYIGSGSGTAGEVPTLKLNKLGGTDWQKTRAKVKAAVKDIAKEITRLYAERSKTTGYPFPEDDDMQNDFERRFEFEETDDQLKCIDEIKTDMEKAMPMDRLLCGDVGFGKTEVALRAAFKCVAGGKQCAILVPTTILAMQHYQTAIKRMDGFPIKIEILSRFRTAKDQEKIIKKTNRGEIDILIGTHRLVQKDVKFKNLGLVIIDEEQRFGVAQKEKLKIDFNGVDVLTLSATPIPRTLNMALSGVRDLSAINQAPENRQPVQTYVLEYDKGIIGDAISKEIRRNGQVFYLHNRVESIERTAANIKQMVPEARVAVAHGKMNEQELSEIWRMMLENEVDVLVCTTIIETGVDLPNVNTLIIENADNFGLSQLHQLRGRVGRSGRRAFAYLTFTKDKVLSEVASKRLMAIREFTEFGAGFMIAMRDLEIRGAGNILGGEQHGHMDAVGYDMYLKMLEDAIKEEKGQPVKEDKECLVDIAIEAHIPERYIKELSERLDIYRRISDIRTIEDSQDVVDELIDRFGEPPKSVLGLVEVGLLRNKAAAIGIYEIDQRGENIIFFINSVNLDIGSKLSVQFKRRVLLNAGTKPHVSVRLEKGQQPINCVKEVLSFLCENN